ncbi:MAG: MarC family protein [Candidatus Bilamarchaeaceae archaeon]
MADFLMVLLPAVIYLLIIIDPIPGIPVFLSLTKGFDREKMHKAATEAVVIAGAIALFFLLVGPQLLEIMHITLKDFKIAGGLVLMLLGLESVLSFSLSKAEKNAEKSISAVSVLIATPLLTGPGLITALIILADEKGFPLTLAALLVALFISWLLLFNSELIRRTLGNKTIEISTKIVGLLILALGVSYVKAGLGMA